MDSKSMQPGATPGLSAIFLGSIWINDRGRTALDETTGKPVKKRFYRKRVRLFNVINKMKLWPSRNGNLHGVKTIVVNGNTAKITTHCNNEFYVNNSLNSRAGRWLRNKWYLKACPDCRVPDWKLEKYSSTRFRRHQGSMLLDAAPEPQAEIASP